MTLLIIHTALCGMLFITCWCRIVKTSERQTRPIIRTSVGFSAMVSIVVGLAPWGNGMWSWFPAYQPHPVVIMVLGAFTAVQVSTAAHWRFGTPRSFQKRTS